MIIAGGMVKNLDKKQILLAKTMHHNKPLCRLPIRICLAAKSVMLKSAVESAGEPIGGYAHGRELINDGKKWQSALGEALAVVPHRDTFHFF